MARDDIHIESDDFEEAPIPDEDVDAVDVDEIESEDEGDEELEVEDIEDADVQLDDDFEAGEDEELEELGLWIPDGAQPETQGNDPNVAELGEEGNGDLSPEDL